MAVPAVHCGTCVSLIEREMMKLPEVEAARVNLSLRSLMLTMAAESPGPEKALNKLSEIGYPAVSMNEADRPGQDAEQMMLLRALAVSGFAAANIMLLSVSVWSGAEGATRDLFHFISALIAIPAVAVAGMPFFRSAAGALRHRRMNMDVPISLGVLLATAMSLYESLIGGTHAYFDAAVSLLFFLLIGRVLDHMMRGRARQLVSRLARMSAKGGMEVQADGSLRYVELVDITPGMQLRVVAGERFPVDGKVIAGDSDVDRSLVTGESAPARAEPGIAVEAGTLNLTGAVDMEATRAAAQSFLADVMRMMAAAEAGRGTYVRIADRVARAYAPAVHVLALATFTGWMIATAGDWHQALTVAVSVLIITCPCALGLAVPVAHVVGASRLFEEGILAKDGAALERLAEANYVTLDKTGTLTTGEPWVASCSIPAGNGRRFARAMALRSLHPASQALAQFLGDEAPLALDSVREVPGNGVEATAQGRRMRLGRPAWVAEIAMGSITSKAGIAFCMEGEAPSAVVLSETLRDGAQTLVQSLRGLPAEILSGDSADAVKRVADKTAIAAWHAGLQPGGKLERLAELAADGKKVLMVGDGLNDAPSLAAAHVSFAPASASDVGRTAADFIFTRGDLSAISFARDMALRTQRTVIQNFGLAIVYNLFAVPLAMAGMLSPLIAAAAMSTSSIIVVGNSLRLQLGNRKVAKTRAAETSPSRPQPAISGVWKTS
jgi:Cu2+-exporting ATPase